MKLCFDKVAQYVMGCPSVAGRVLSLAWHKSGTMIVTGSLDTIRVLDVKSGKLVCDWDVMA